MNEDLAERHAQSLEETLGFSGRMISFSKTGYDERHPAHATVFNANLCLADGKVWHGDLDLTEDEPRLAELARRVNETVYVLYEYDGRFENEDAPLLDRAPYSVTPTGHTCFDHRHLERRADGTLARRPPESIRRARWRWRALRHRPRLLRFWQLERKRERVGSAARSTRTTLLYVGTRDEGATPLLVLGRTRAERLQSFELTWYPAKDSRGGRYAPRPLVDLTARLPLGRLRVWLRILVWPGQMCELLGGYRRKRV